MRKLYKAESFGKRRLILLGELVVFFFEGH